MPNTFACPQCARSNRVNPDRPGARCGHCKTPIDTSGTPLHFDDEQLARVLRSSPVPVLVDFYADWCGPCRALAPHLESVGRKHAGALMVVKVDTEKFQRHASLLGVQGIPAVYLYKGGAVVDKATGMRPAPFWEGMVAPHLG